LQILKLVTCEACARLRWSPSMAVNSCHTLKYLMKALPNGWSLMMLFG
jgi:hypothetical protein